MYTIEVDNVLYGLFTDFDEAESNAYYYFDCQNWCVKQINATPE